jgi:hypothetical protein
VPEQRTFEARLADALERYSQRAPARVDSSAVIEAVTTLRPPRRIGLTWPALRAGFAPLAVRIAIVVALLATAGLIIAGNHRTPTKPSVDRRLMVTVGTSAWIFDASLRDPLVVEVADHCETALVDGGRMLVTHQRYQGYRSRPVTAGPEADVPFVPRGITTDDGGGSGRWSPDRTRLAIIRAARTSEDQPSDGPGTIFVYSVDGVAERSQRTYEVQGLQSAAWSPDSTRLAATRWVGGSFEVIEVDVLSGRQRAIGTYTSAIDDPSFPVAWAGNDHVVVRVGTASGDRDARIEVASGADSLLAAPARPWSWSPDGSRAIGAAADGRQILVGGDGVTLADLHGEPILTNTAEDRVWSFDSRHLATADAGRTVLRITDADGTASTILPTGDGTDPAAMSIWSPDSMEVATVSFGERSFRLWLWDISTGATMPMANIDQASPSNTQSVCLQWVPAVP